MDATDEWLTAKQAADQLGISDRILYEVLADGKLHHYRFGRNTIRIKPADLQAYRDACRRTEPISKPEPEAEVKSALHHFQLPPSPSRRRA